MNAIPAVNPESANRKYIIRTVLFMGGYIAANLAALSGAFDDITPRGALAFALVVSAPILGHIWAFLAWIRESDEFVRGIATKRFVMAGGITLAVSCSVKMCRSSTASSTPTTCWSPASATRQT